MNNPFVIEQARPPGRLDPAGDLRRLRPTRPTASAGCTVASSGGLPNPTSWPWRPISSAGSPAPPAFGWTAGSSSRRARSRRHRALSPWEQLAQVLLLTNEFMFME